MDSNALTTGITVIICTYNGAKKLEPTLEHLSKQETDRSFPWEIILIDNMSSDDTERIAIDYWDRYGKDKAPLIIDKEEKAGKYFAFQKAISLARYSYFIICDDDNWLDKKYLIIVFKLLEQDLRIGAVGGFSRAVSEDNCFPKWFAHYQEGYAVGSQYKKTGYLPRKGHLWGAGLASRTSLYQELYKDWPSLLLSMDDKKVLSTEDTELCYRITMTGLNLYYTQNLILDHFIPKEKLTTSYRDSLYTNFSKSQKILAQYLVAIKIEKLNIYTVRNRLKIFFLKIKLRLKLIFIKKPKKIYREKLFLRWLNKDSNSQGDFFVDDILKKMAAIRNNKFRS